MSVQAGDRAAELSGGSTISLGIAAGIMFLAAASLAGLALAGSGGPMAITLASAGALAMAIALAAVGVEALRRRNFWFVVFVPAAMAVFNLVYALYSGTYEGALGGRHVWGIRLPGISFAGNIRMTVILLVVVVALLVGMSPGLTLMGAAVAGLALERWAPGWRRDLG